MTMTSLTHPRTRMTFPTVIVVLVAAAALAAGCGSSSSSKHGGSGTAKTAGAATTSKIWAVGYKWDVTVTQNSSIASPADSSGTEGTSYDQVYHFSVADAPTAKSPLWRVHAELEGAQGPLANGFSLWYTEQPDHKSMKLTQVALGTEHPSDPTGASAIFGQAFPLEQTYTAPPKSHKVKAPKGGAETGTSLPPALPKG